MAEQFDCQAMLSPKAVMQLLSDCGSEPITVLLQSNSSVGTIQGADIETLQHVIPVERTTKYNIVCHQGKAF